MTISEGTTTESPSRPLVAGRFVHRALTCAVLLLAGCFPVQSSTNEGPRTAAPVDPAIEAGPPLAGAASAAATLIDDANAALRRGSAAEARDLAGRVIERYPTAPGSSSALWIRARAAAQLGESGAALEDALRFRALLPDPDPRRVEISLFVARTAHDGGDGITALRALLALDGPQAREAVREGMPLLREVVRALPTDSLLALVPEVPRTPFGDLVKLESAVGLYFRGEVAQAAQWGRELLQSDLAPEDRRVAQSLVEGNAETVLGGDVTIGAILPTTGSPALREYATAIEEGIRVAFETRARDSRRPVRLELRDDGGDRVRAERAMRELETGGALGVIGPLVDDEVAAAAASRTAAMALISPTAEQVPPAAGVYSLGANDPGAVRALAAYVAQERYVRVAILYPRTPLGVLEAQTFRDALEGSQDRESREIREFTYEPGTTFFRDQLTGVAEFGAQALALPIQESDVELIAPQISFFALDSLGVQVLGTGAWGSPEVMQRVDARHLDGVVLASARDPEGESPAYQTFVQRYEQVIRKTLRSPIPAFGYDAASLILEAVDRGARTPADLQAQLEGIRDFEGATGRISILNGQIVRRHQLYEIRGGRLRYLGRSLN